MSELDSARRLISRGKSEQAASLLAEVIAENPGQRDAWLLMAQAVKDPQQKLDCYLRVLEIDPENLIAQKGVNDAKLKISASQGQNQFELSSSKKNSRRKITKEKRITQVSFIQRVLKLQFLLPVIFFILVTAIAFLVLKNRPAANPTVSATINPSPLPVAQTPVTTTQSTPIPTEDSRMIFALLPFKIYYAQNGKLWLWQQGTAKSLSDIDPLTTILNEQSDPVVFTLHGSLWKVDAQNPSPQLLISASSLQKGTPSPGSSNETLVVAGFIPQTESILFSTKVGSTASQLVNQADLYTVKSDGSGVLQLLGLGQGGVPSPSPDGRWLAIVNSSTIRLLSLSDRKVQTVLEVAEIPTSDGYFLPSPTWAEDSSSFAVVIPPTDFADNLNAPTAVWQVDIRGQKTAFPSIQTRGGKAFFSANLQSVLYQLNLATPSDYFGELHLANIDGTRDIILFNGQLAHLIGWEPSEAQVVFQLQNDPRSIEVGDPGTGQSHPVLTGLDSDNVISISWINDQVFLYQTVQTDAVRLWLAQYDGTLHPSLLLVENNSGNEIPFSFIP